MPATRAPKSRRHLIEIYMANLQKADLIAPIHDGDLLLEQVAEPHREAMRAACAADPDIWDIYPIDLLGNFDASFDAMLADDDRCPFALIHQGHIIGMSGYLSFALPKQTVEIGNTYMAPVARGTGVNLRIKRLLIERAFGCGIRRIEFRVDERNGRSQAAVLKLGARREGLLMAERVTWTGHVRNTCVFGLLPEDWAEGVGKGT